MSQVHTRDFTAQRREIARMKLAKEVAKSVDKFIAVSCRTIRLQPSHPTESERETGSVIGERLPDPNGSSFCRFLAA